MNLAACGELPRTPETRVWYRAIRSLYWQTALHTEHTKSTPSRYNAGSAVRRPFTTLYLAEDHPTALYEVGAMFGLPFADGGSIVVPNPTHAWVLLNVRVTLASVADLTKVTQHELLGTTAQELTGDWRGYSQRVPHDSVHEPTGTAPTQALGEALFRERGLEGFRAPSARQPARMILVVFPEKLRAGSLVEFSDGHGHTHRIEPRPPRRRRVR